MADVAEPICARPRRRRAEWRSICSVRIRSSAEYVVIPLFALVVSAFLFSLFLLALGKSPLDFFELVYRGGFGTAFSIQNTLQRSAPLILTALAVAVPARIGLVMIGGEGALVLGGFASAAIAIPLVVGKVPPIADADHHGAGRASSVGAVWVGIAGYLRYARGVNETISSLLLTYIGIAIMNFFVEGSLRDLDQSEQAFDHADRRRLHGRQDSRHRRALGPCGRHPARDRAAHPAVAHDLRLCGARQRRQSARRAGARACRSAS